LYHYFILAAFTLSSLLFTACGSKALLEESPALKQKEKQAAAHSSRTYYNKYFEYHIAPHDRVKVSVYGHPELGSESEAGILVDGSGKINLPLIGTVQIGGLTQPRASLRLQSRYGKYLKKSNVRLEVLNKKAFVVGEVKKAGPVALPNDQISLLQAIASSGGFGDYADKSKIAILRKQGRGTKLELIDLTNLTSLSHTSMMVRPGDVVYVSPNGMKNIGTNIMPFFKLAADAMLPFIRYQDLTN